MKITIALLPALLAVADAASGVSVPLQLRGKYKTVGMTTHVLTDKSRTDKYDPKHGKRNVLVHFYYPTTSSHKATSVYGPAAFLRGIEKEYGVPNGTLDAVSVHAETNAPFDTSAIDLPLVLFSPGMGAASSVYSEMAVGLVSHGYVVASINHAYDASLLVYPDGTVVVGHEPPAEGGVPSEEYIKELTTTRTLDAKFVLNTITAKGKQGDFIPGCAPKPHALCTCYSTKKVGMFGHSMGGATTADVMLTDKRVKAGINIDGMFINEGADAKQGKLPGPFMIMQGSVHNRTSDPTYQTFWNAQHGKVWLREVGFKGYQHLSYSDFPAIIDGLGFRDFFPPGFLEPLLGTVSGPRNEEIVDAFTTNFFDMALKGKKATVINGPSKQFPEAMFEN